MSWRERLARAWRRRVFTHELLCLARREVAMPVPPGDEKLEQRLVMRRATAADALLWQESWAAKVPWYLERLKSATEFCWLGIVDGRLAVHCWYNRGPYFDPMMKHTFDPGPSGAYFGEGWVHPDFRVGGLAIAFNRRIYGEVLPALGVQQVLCYYATDNVASVKLQARFGFVEVGWLHHWKILGRHGFARAAMPKGREQGAEAAAATTDRTRSPRT
ncbi:MAG: hypothetical protein EXS13_07685 [Planctomycetes bacterium]|nr:hypothetical protein [Planctomycetota bacterium]